jgi:hypothetical protein
MFPETPKEWLQTIGAVLLLAPMLYFALILAFTF